MELYKTLLTWLLPLLFCLNIVESGIDLDLNVKSEQKLKLKEKKAPLKAFTVAELAEYDGSNVSA